VTKLTSIKITLAIVGIALFGAGMRLGDQRLRFAGLACVAVAALLRFWKDRRPGDGA